MKKNLLQILRCISCGESDFSLVSECVSEPEILEGAVHCTGCGRELAIQRGILRSVSDDSYVDNFSFEWQLHRKTQFDNEKRRESESAFTERTGLTASDVHDKDVLDVGVGTGRFADVVERAGARVVGIDLSYAVETAMENVGSRSDVNIVQADCTKLPFKTESFDIIYSIGVLHHTPNTKHSFLSLLPYLRPGGIIAIWLYDAHVWSPGSSLEVVNRFWRFFTTRMPSRLLYAMCLLELPYYYLRKIPGFGKAVHMLLPGAVFHAIPPTNDHARVSEHILDTFDWYSPKYQFKHTYPEVFQWFEEAGLEAIRINQEPVAISGRKPLATNPSSARQGVAPAQCFASHE